MSREKDLIKNTLILGFGKMLPKFIAIITLPIITAQLTKTEYGTYDFISTLVMLLLPVATLQIQSAAFRFLIDYRNDSYNSSRIITNIFVVTIPISALFSFGILLFMKNVDIYLRGLISLYFFMDILYITISQIARGLNMNKIFSISSIILSSINACGIVLSVQLAKTGLRGVIFSLLIAEAIGTIYLTVKTHLSRYLKISTISMSTIREMISYSWPMIPNNLSNWILKLSDRMVITTVLGIEANAIYAVANKIPNLLSIAQSIFIMAWQENASIAVKDIDADKYYTKMFDQTFSLMFSFTALLIAFTPIIFKLLIRGDYTDAYVQMPILILGMFFCCMSSFQGGIYVAHKKTKSVGITTTLAALCNLLIDILLINFIGITAGSLSTLISYFLLYIFRLIDVLKFQKMNYNIKKQFSFMVVLIIMLGLCFKQNIILNIINIIIGTTSFIIVNKSMMHIVFKHFSKTTGGR